MVPASRAQVTTVRVNSEPVLVQVRVSAQRTFYEPNLETEYVTDHVINGIKLGRRRAGATRRGGAEPMAGYAARLGKNSDGGLHNGRASFETRPMGAPQSLPRRRPGMRPKSLMAFRRVLILRRPRKRPSRGTQGGDPADPRFLAASSAHSAARNAAHFECEKALTQLSNALCPPP